jgi:hypothetical protein
MPSRVRDHPYLTLLAAVSAVMMLVGRINHAQGWGDWLFIAGIVVLVGAGALFLFSRR